MLCLSRKTGEKLRIGDNIVVTINWIRGDKVSIGIEAPPEVEVLREEAQRRRAAGTSQAGPHPAPLLIEPTEIPGQFRYM